MQSLPCFDSEEDLNEHTAKRLKPNGPTCQVSSTSLSTEESCEDPGFGGQDMKSKQLLRKAMRLFHTVQAGRIAKSVEGEGCDRVEDIEGYAELMDVTHEWSADMDAVLRAKKYAHRISRHSNSVVEEDPKSIGQSKRLENYVSTEKERNRKRRSTGMAKYMWELIPKADEFMVGHEIAAKVRIEVRPVAED